MHAARDSFSERRVHPAAGDYIRIRPPRCPTPGGSRPCTSRAAICGMPRDISGGGSSFETAASCICVSLVGSFICQKQGGDRGNCTIGQQSSSNRCDSSRCTVRSYFARAIYPRNRRVVQR